MKEIGEQKITVYEFDGQIFIKQGASAFISLNPKYAIEFCHAILDIKKEIESE
jgi:hypothetical protein